MIVIRRGTFPFVTVSIILLNVLVFLFELSLGRRQLDSFLFQFGVIPVKVYYSTDIPGSTFCKYLFSFSQFYVPSWRIYSSHREYVVFVDFGDNIEDKLDVSNSSYFISSVELGLLLYMFILTGNPSPLCRGKRGYSWSVGAYMVTLPKGAGACSYSPCLSSGRRSNYRQSSCWVFGFLSSF